MSLEQAKLFMEKMKTDEAFRAKIMSVQGVSERLQMANSEGYDFTEEEIKTVLAELGDAVVEGIAGGAGGDDAENYGCNTKYPCGCWAQGCKKRSHG
jgi:predicted ribosomally synthesized peptide with nif11-like leader